MNIRFQNICYGIISYTKQVILLLIFRLPIITVYPPIFLDPWHLQQLSLPPSSRDQSYVTWNNRNYNTSWRNKGGDWFDRNNAAQSNVFYASVTFGASTLPDNRYYNLDVTGLVKGYVNGTEEPSNVLFLLIIPGKG